MAELTDAEAVKRVLSGDADAFRILTDRHARGLYRVAYRITGTMADAEDVTQEAFIRAYRQLATYDARAAVSTWLHRITVNCAVDFLRARRRKREQDDEKELEMAKTTHDPERGMDIRAAVTRGMKTLTESERTAFVLRHFEGKSIEEIGRALGTKVNATKHTIFRAVQKLRRELEPLVG